MKQFNVKTWLLMSLIPGIFAAFVVVPILLVVVELPSSLSILGGIFAALAVGFVIELHNMQKQKEIVKENEARQAKIKEENSKKAEVKRKARRIAFYSECRSCKIFSEQDLVSPEKILQFQQVAEKHHIPYSDLDDLKCIFQIAAEEYLANQQKTLETRKKEGEKRQQTIAAELEVEKQQLSVLLRYSQTHGKEKTYRMLNDELSPLKAQINGSSLTPPPLISKQKESDGMFAAGTAYGIGGVIPAAASLARTEQKNAQIRQANAQIDQINSALVGAVAVANADRMRCAARMKNFRNDFFKKCSLFQIDESTETIFSHLKFSHTESIVSETGSITVKTKVSTDGKIRAFGKAAYADGSIIAGIYSGGVKIGEATLVLPILGTGNLHYRKRVLGWQGNDESIELSGICLSCGAVPTLSYTVRFAPGDLWAINQSWF